MGINTNRNINLADTESSDIPVVSVVIITYNQENTVRKTLDSVLSQKCDFNYEIVVCDDFSRDMTSNILYEYKNKFPQCIQIFINNENIGLIKNYYKAISLCQGNYIAQCAGDDFWIRDDKLQIQVNSIRSDDNIGLIHTDCDFLIEETGEIIRNRNKTKGILIPSTEIFENLLLNNFIIAATVLIRKEIIRKVNVEDYLKHNFSMEDYPLWLEISKHARISYMDISTACYRVHKNSVSGRNDTIKKLNFFVSSIKVRDYFLNKYKSVNENQIKTKDFKTFLLKSKEVRFIENRHKYLLFKSIFYLIIRRKNSFSDMKNFILSIIPKNIILFNYSRNVRDLRLY